MFDSCLSKITREAEGRFEEILLLYKRYFYYKYKQSIRDTFISCGIVPIPEIHPPSFKTYNATKVMTGVLTGKIVPTNTQSIDLSGCIENAVDSYLEDSDSDDDESSIQDEDMDL